MKKLLTLFVLMLVCIGQTFAYDFEVDGIYYNKSGSNATVTYKTSSHNSYSGRVSIPATVTYGGVTYNVTEIGREAFAECSALSSVSIPSSVTYIGNWAFYRCVALTSVTLPNSVKEIGIEAFRYCSGLTSVTLPNSVTSIGGGAFEFCTGLTSVTIPNSVTRIGERAFNGCSGVKTLIYAEGCTTTLPIYLTSITSITIPNSVTSIGNSAFYNCSGLTSVTIPNSVTSIEESAFYECSGLTSVTIPNSVTKIGMFAFYGCSGLTSVTIPNSVKSIRQSTFYNCSGLTSVTIGSSVESIEYNAFYGCSGLTSITIPSNVIQFGDNIFESSGLSYVIMKSTSPPIINRSSTFPKGTIIYVPKKCASIYASSRNWNEFDIREIAVSLDNTSQNLYVGQTLQLSATKDPADMTVAWSSSNSSVATVSSNGLVTAKKAGTTTITVASTTDSSIKATCTITVNNQTISINNTSSTLYVGQTLQLSAIKSPTNMTVAWSSSNSSVATVSSNGLVTAKKAGTTTITVASTTDSSIKATCTITVNNQTISISNTSSTLYVGQTLQLSAIKIPTNMTVAWSSSNSSVATVSSNGLVTARQAGATTITVASTIDSSKKATCTITVKRQTISTNKISSTLYPGQTLQLSATKDPADMTVAWSSSNSSVATVSSNGLVTAKKAGTTTITVASTSDSSVKATCAVSVKSVQLTMSASNKVLSAGEAVQLSVSSNQSNPSVAWSSSDNAVATVSSSGKVTAVKVGSALITAKLTTESDVTATCLIDVQDGNVMYVGGIYYNKTGTNTAEVTNRIAGVDCPEAPRTEYSGTINVPASITYSGKTYNVTAIGKRAFYYMPNLQSVVIPNSVKTINEKAFEKSEKLARVIFMESASSALELIGKRAFYGCSRLDGFAMPNRVHTVENEGFRYCTSLSDLTLSTSLNMINEYAFANCTALSTLTLPNSISSVQNYGFAYDSALKDIELPANMQGVGAYCFTDCTALTTVKFNTAISTMTVGSNAFKGCSKLSRVEISRVDSWVQTNFYDQYANPTSIAHHLYKNGSELTSVAIPSGTMYINNNVFSGCSSIKDVTIPSTVQYINDNIFLNCTSMNKVICNATNVPPFIGTDNPTKMNAVFNKASLYVPATSVSKYKGDSWWKRFHYIGSLDEITHTITKIEEVNANKCYIIFTDERGGLTVKGQNDTRIWGTSEEDVNQEVSMGDVFQHFAFVKQGDKLYLYNVATKKYVSDDLRGALTDQPSAPITFADASDGTVRLVFDASHNINLGGSKQVLIDNWTYKDAGNSFHIMEAGDFSGVVAAISPIATGNTMTPEFDLQGRMVKNWPYQRGVSIVNGRKIIR